MSAVVAFSFTEQIPRASLLESNSRMEIGPEGLNFSPAPAFPRNAAPWQRHLLVGRTPRHPARPGRRQKPGSDCGRRALSRVRKHPAPPCARRQKFGVLPALPALISPKNGAFPAPHAGPGPGQPPLSGFFLCAPVKCFCFPRPGQIRSVFLNRGFSGPSAFRSGPECSWRPDPAPCTAGRTCPAWGAFWWSGTA